MSQVSTPFEAFQSMMAAYGLLLCDAHPVDVLPNNVWLNRAKFGGGSLLLLGHAGGDFWKAFKRRGFVGNDPVDDFSSQVSERALETCFPGIKRERLFPSENCPINLMALGKVFGWHHASPLGMGIHSKYGLWSAYRALWWLDTEDLKSYGLVTGDVLPQTKAVLEILPAVDVCSDCTTQECVVTCPAEAIQYQQTPNLSRCADYRLQKESDCASTCLSRMACPYASEYQYTTEQMAYHYDQARSAIAAYRSTRK